MGKAKDLRNPPLGAYHDEPHRDDTASTSSAVPLLDQIPLDESLPPAYSDDTIQDDGRRRRNTVEQSPYWLQSAYQKRWHKDAKGSKSTVLSSKLASDPKALREYMILQSRIAPEPMVRMTGTHTETRRNDKKTEKVKVVDFDLTISLSGLLKSYYRKSTIVENEKKTYRGGRTRTVAPGFKADVEATHPVPQLEEWYHRFCASDASVKTFTITRRITDRDDGYLVAALTSLLRTTNYRGHINIKFPVEDRATIVMSDHFINRHRCNVYVWWICVILQLWIFTWPVLWLMTKRWEVLSARWTCAVQAVGFPGRPIQQTDEPGWLLVEDVPLSDIEQRTGESEVQFKQRTTGITEQNWVEAWKRTIIAGAEGRKQQELTFADSIEERAVAERIGERGREQARNDNQGGFLGAATDLIRGVSDVLRDAEMSRGWGGDT